MMAMNIKFKVPKVFKSVRYSLLGANGFFLLTGILLLLVGIIVNVKFAYYDQLITNRFFSVTGFAIATAVIIILISGLGFYAAISQQFLFIVGYVAFLLIMLVFDIVLTVIAFTLSEDAESEIRSTMVQSLQFYSSRLEVAKMWDDLQMGFECCGVTGRFDWISTQIPVSCCHVDYGTISPFVCTTANAYPQGCSKILGEYLSHQAMIIGITGIVVTVLMVLITSIGIEMARRSKFEEVELES